MDGDELAAFLRETEEIIADSPEMDEANTKAKVIRPLLETLGWDIAADAVLEYGFQMGSSTHHVDYALLLDGAPELFVEAKASRTTVTDRHLEQLFTYMKTQNVDWGLLTNGGSYFVCRRRIDDDDAVVVDVLGDCELDELPDHETLLSALSKESIAEGRSEEIASNIYELREAYETLQDRKESIVDEITDVFVDELGEQVTRHSETAARTAVEELSESIESDTQGTPSVDASGVFWNEVESEVGLVKQGNVVVIPDSKSATQCFTDFVDFLFEHDYLDAGDVPIDSGRKRYLINDQPVDKEGDEMTAPREVGDGFFLETNYSRSAIKQRILELAEYTRE
mgnify:FL=1